MQKDEKWQVRTNIDCIKTDIETNQPMRSGQKEKGHRMRIFYLNFASAQQAH